MAGVSVEDIQEEFADLDMDITDDEILLKLKVRDTKIRTWDMDVRHVPTCYNKRRVCSNRGGGRRDEK